MLSSLPGLIEMGHERAVFAARSTRLPPFSGLMTIWLPGP